MHFDANTLKEEVFKKVGEFLRKKKFSVVDKDNGRPWGGYFVIDEKEAGQFINNFFSGHTRDEFSEYARLSPKILLVEPKKRLSWQYHYRRSEIWTVISGEVGVMISDTDEPGEVMKLRKGDEVELKQGQRHRLIGLDEWGIIAEIWKHTDPRNPSNEEDIVRIQDDFGR